MTGIVSDWWELPPKNNWVTGGGKDGCGGSGSLGKEGGNWHEEGGKQQEDNYQGKKHGGSAMDIGVGRLCGVGVRALTKEEEGAGVSYGGKEKCCGDVE
jgi:hypothetical protein